MVALLYRCLLCFAADVAHLLEQCFGFRARLVGQIHSIAVFHHISITASYYGFCVSISAITLKRVCPLGELHWGSRLVGDKYRVELQLVYAFLRCIVRVAVVCHHAVLYDVYSDCSAFVRLEVNVCSAARHVVGLVLIVLVIDECGVHRFRSGVLCTERTEREVVYDALVTAHGVHLRSLPAVHEQFYLALVRLAYLVALDVRTVLSILPSAEERTDMCRIVGSRDTLKHVRRISVLHYVCRYVADIEVVSRHLLYSRAFVCRLHLSVNLHVVFLELQVAMSGDGLCSVFKLTVCTLRLGSYRTILFTYLGIV